MKEMSIGNRTLKLYTATEAAEALDVSEKTLRRYIQSGKLAAAKYNGRWMIDEGNIIRFLTGGSIASGDK